MVRQFGIVEICMSITYFHFIYSEICPENCPPVCAMACPCGKVEVLGCQICKCSKLSQVEVVSTMPSAIELWTSYMFIQCSVLDTGTCVCNGIQLLIGLSCIQKKKQHICIFPSLCQHVTIITQSIPDCFPI